MCSVLADINAQSTDEELFLFLERLIGGSPLPSNVIEGINPCSYMPENLPSDIWYLVSLGEKKHTEEGFWRARGEPSQIFISPAIAGWTATFEFYEGRAPDGSKTDWFMQEYRIISKISCKGRKPKEFCSLCRVFLIDGKNPDHEKQNLTSVDGADGFNIYKAQPVASDAKSNSEQGYSSEPQANKEDRDRGILDMDERQLSYPADILHESSCLLEGDYLELRDLESPSFSSDNTSCLTMSSDECFDSLELLRELESDINQDLQPENGDCKFSVSSSHKPTELVLCPQPTSELLHFDENIKPEASENAKADHLQHNSAYSGNLLGKRALSLIRSHDFDRKVRGASSRSCADTSSSGAQKTASSGKLELDIDRNRKKKLKKKYLCFLPF